MTFIQDSDFKAAQIYGHDKSVFGFYKSLYSFAQSVLVIYYNLLPSHWVWSGEFIAPYFLSVEDPFAREVLQSALFFFSYMFISKVLDLPFDLFFTFIIEAKHGFKTEKMTLGLFCTDFFKSTLLTWLFGTPVLAAFLYTIRWGGDHFYIYVTALVLALNLLAVLIFPTVIQPCFNKVEPLEAGPLRDAIEALAKKVHFPLSDLFKIDGSKRSAHRLTLYSSMLRAKHLPNFTDTEL